MSDIISNPDHYIKGRKYEPRKVIEDWELDFYLGNALKYIARAGRKDNAIEDLEKAKQYLDFEIEKLSNKKVCFGCVAFGERINPGFCVMDELKGYTCYYGDKDA